MNYDNMAIII